ncbi:MAG: Asp23/Gls24 family envelope stress response protein [Clostridia bacterium]|nr:Asp23/Gls24 family envelope stress response protein [Clostridia bacterium]
MQVYAFVGKTGTGKSYHAQEVANKYNIRYIIDDAILIKENKVIAGRSAKTEASKIASVKAAIFLNEERRIAMVKAIKKENPDKLLILGTSDDMVKKIAENLEVGEISKTIYIQEIASSAQIEEARRSRVEDGKHVVPVPTFEIKKQFSGYFLENLKIFDIFKKQDSGEYETSTSEKTIIRPTYSYLGNYSISDNVINSIISHSVSKVNGVTRVFRVATQKYSYGMKLDIDIEVKFGKNIQKISSEVRNVVIYAIDYATGINLYGIDINIKSIEK